MTAVAAPEPREGRTGPPFADASPADVRAAVIPEEQTEFDQQWHELMARATENLDLTEVFDTLNEWRRIERIAEGGSTVEMRASSAPSTR